MTDFLELRKSVNGNSIITHKNDYTENLDQLISLDPTSDYYRSMFLYPVDILEHHKQNKGVGKFSGKVVAPYLLFDIDSKQDLNLAKNDTSKLMNTLLTLTGLPAQDFLKCIELYFSGNKGFHVVLNTNQSFSPKEMKAICKKISEISGITETLDLAIYNTTRIIRIEGTINTKSGLYKIQLNPKTFKSHSCEDIKELAKTKGTYYEKHDFKFDFANYKDFIKEEPKKSVVVDTKETVDGVRGLDTINFKKCPNYMPRCMYALSKGVMVPGRGERHTIYLGLARFWKNQGYTDKETYRLLKATSEANAAIYPESTPYNKDRIWNEIIVSVYDDKEDAFYNKGGWGVNPKNDTVFEKYCNLLDSYTASSCIMHAGGGEKDTYTVDELLKDYAEFSKTYEESIIKTGISFIDQELEIMRGTVSLIVGAAGSGKTTFALKLLENASKAGIPTVMFSMDMNKRPLFEKLFLKHTSYNKLEVREKLKANDRNLMLELEKILETHYKHVVFLTKGTMTSEEMKNRVMEIGAERGKIGLVLVDYAGRISSGKSDSYANDKHNALRAPEIASDTDAAWVYLAQVGRNHGDSHTPLRTKRAAKGAGDWEEAAQNVLTIWRPFADLHDVVYEDDDLEEPITFKDGFMRCYTAKNRMGKSREVILLFNGKNVEEMSEQQTDEYLEDFVWKEKYAWKYKAGSKAFQ